ncbi:hypothetical protein ACI2KS_05585 [Pseudomonas sp. NPDC087358]|uniref:hypothetical protein n=1 Tax=Pseudomonas sp. NPDC087358 TaxID=3364439 RepID=UPI0038515F6E
MLDRTKVEDRSVEVIEFEWHALTKIERRLITLYRRMRAEERQQLRRLTEVLVGHPDEAESL